MLEFKQDAPEIVKHYIDDPDRLITSDDINDWSEVLMLVSLSTQMIHGDITDSIYKQGYEIARHTYKTDHDLVDYVTLLVCDDIYDSYERMVRNKVMHLFVNNDARGYVMPRFQRIFYNTVLDFIERYHEYYVAPIIEGAKNNTNK